MAETAIDPAIRQAVDRAVAEATAPLHSRIVEMQARQEYLEKRLGEEAARRRIEDGIIMAMRKTMLTLVEDPDGGERPPQIG